TNRDGVELGVEGACGFGKSPNPTGDAFFDASLDNNTRGFNVPHAMFEIEVPLTKNADGEPRPNGGVYDPSPAFWSAAAPGSGTLVLSQNMVSILIGGDASGTSTVSPLPFTLALKRARSPSTQSLTRTRSRSTGPSRRQQGLPSIRRWTG